jgi:DNA-binding PadR family transcriptional regulator
MSATRLLVLGVIRIAQPVHGYEVRRELLSWRVDEMANVKPGSVYSAIRTLEKDGCIAVHSRESEDARPERTTYVITGEGEKEFFLLLRQAWWTVTSSTEPLIPGLCLMPFMPREELVGALQARLGQLEGQLSEDGATGAEGEIPEHVREIMDFMASRTKSEAEWARALQKRVRDGSYHFAGEPGFPDLGPGLTHPSSA